MNPPSNPDPASGPQLDASALHARLMQGPGMAVICVSHRLAQQLQAQHAQACHAAGLQAWETPQILALDGFLQQAAEAARLDLQQQGAPLPVLLAPQEQRLLWRLAIAETRSEQPLLREAEAAQLAAEAWTLLREYELPFPLPASTPDVERFNRWATQYGQRCRALGRVDQPGWRERLLQDIA
ncbi:MAG TPA: hypothetical protein VLI06_14495, partial [Solimonas sp.]|nr:hypothetical protein [Solimonas sp.]